MNLNPFRKGFRTPKKPNRKQVEEAEKIRAFLTDYGDICAKHEMQLMPIIKHHEHGGSEPDFKIGPYKPAPKPEMKGWGDAMEENLKVAKACRHLNEDGIACKHCAVRMADQHESGTGVTAEYEEIKLKKIADWREKAKQHDQEAPAL